MAAYLLVLISIAGISFLLCCLWHFVRETKHGRSSVVLCSGSSRRDTVPAVRMSRFRSQTYIVSLGDEGRALP